MAGSKLGQVAVVIVRGCRGLSVEVVIETPRSRESLTPEPTSRPPWLQREHGNGERADSASGPCATNARKWFSQTCQQLYSDNYNGNIDGSDNESNIGNCHNNNGIDPTNNNE
jgi:hypothetical protein